MQIAFYMFFYHIPLVEIFHCIPKTNILPLHYFFIFLYFLSASPSDETVNSGCGQYTSGSLQMGWTGEYKDQHFYGRRIHLFRAFSIEEYQQLQDNIIEILGGKPQRGETCVKFLCHNSRIQGRMQLTQSKEAIVLAVRRSRRDATEIHYCHEAIDTILAAIDLFLRGKGVSYSIKFLSPMSLKHLHENRDIDLSNALFYDDEELDGAESGEEPLLVNYTMQVRESIFDILCQGSDTRYIALKGQECDVLWLPDETLQCLSILDEKKASKEDYQSLGKAIGFDVAKMDKIKQSCTVAGLSITEELLTKWPKNGLASKGPKRTIGNLRTILRVVIGNDYASSKLDRILQVHKHEVSHCD